MGEHGKFQRELALPEDYAVRGIMMATMERSACPVDQDVSAVQGEAAYLTDIERCQAPYFERSEPRQRALPYQPGL
jgi:hypothetical protein